VQAPPAGARTDLEILRGLAERLGRGEGFAFDSAREVFEELRRCTAGAKADYSGISYEKLARENGVFWPCPSPDHPGTPRLFAERFAHPSGRAKFHAVPYRNAAELPDATYPFFFTTGRYKEHYNSGAQTRRVTELTDARPEPRVQVHSRLAEQLGVLDGDALGVQSRRGEVRFSVSVSDDIRPDTLFAPFHWGGRQAANLLTNAALDPKSADQVIRLSQEVIEREKLTTLMVTHSMHQAAHLGSRLIMMYRGEVVHDFRGAEKQRLRVDDLHARFEELRRQEQLDETAAEMLRRVYV
jgi:assimilatory nitrate reductase catalytic subunit